MSIRRLSDLDKLHKKKTHQRKDSDEIDVFDAKQYFSGGITGTAGITQSHCIENKIKAKPSSPSARLASFFMNSFFNKAASEKKKKEQFNKGEEEIIGGGWRKRRSSTSYVNSEIKNVYSSSNTGFRTPPGRDVYKDLRSYSDHRIVPQVSKVKETTMPIMFHDEKMLRLLDDKLKVIVGIDENRKASNTSYRSQFDEISHKEEDHDDEGEESDSSSDLFELKNYDNSNSCRYHP
ncbi:hypothetical protein GIB67_042385 [Kingdonia uniflora]|uniref:Uncharacterized protein n=1 Tax=Kingdonia uniflora TaxID=39325 RepID=A0A7J7P3T4_9MAGN|nr:hypothetical protein GIB67_042385 [Kingdonia uniflora]